MTYENKHCLILKEAGEEKGEREKGGEKREGEKREREERKNITNILFTLIKFFKYEGG